MAVAPSKVVGKVFTTSAYNLSRRVKLGRQLSSIFNRPASLHANCFKTPHVKRSARRCRLQTVSSIGFDLPGSPSAKGIEKQAEELIKLASSLLVYQYVLKQKPGQAFLKILLRLQGGRPADALEAYGEFYHALSIRGYASWQEYVLRQIFWGKHCTFAQQAAAGDLPADAASPAHEAARHDLDVLQQLCVTESTLVSWFRETYPSVGDRWAKAAERLALPSGGRGGEGGDSGGGGGGPAGMCGPPATLEQIRRAGDRLAGSWQWSDGLDVLQAHYEAHGAGLLGLHWVVAWEGDHLAELEPAETAQPRSPSWELLGRLVGAGAPPALADNAMEHLAGGGGGHCLVRGPAGTATSAAVWGALAAAAREGLRVIHLSGGSRQLTHKSLDQLGRKLALHKRLRFVVVLENLQTRMGSEEHSSLVMYLSGMGGSLWPANALLYATTTATGPLLPGSSDGGVLEGCFDLSVNVGPPPGHDPSI
uniref:Uncharacterized protein n=1 Tax=Tetraselmis sp. GSL018 TaxID=582737 RepID=A0A061QXK5_9CHLO